MPLGGACAVHLYEGSMYPDSRVELTEDMSFWLAYHRPKGERAHMK
jgi:hypothetical protein